MSNLFTVTVEFQYIIAAHDKIEAAKVAEKYLGEAFNDTGLTDMTMNVGDFTLPPGWNGDCFPYGGDGDLTISDYLDDE